MANDTRFELLREVQSGEDSPSLSSDNEIKSDKSDKSLYGGYKPIKRWPFGKIAGILVDAAAIGLSLTFLVYGFSVRRYVGTPVAGSFVIKMLKEGAHLVRILAFLPLPFILFCKTYKPSS